MKKPIYLDYNATTPIDPRVRDAMLPYLGGASGDLGHFGNPSSTHAYGVSAHQAIESARSQVASLIRCQPDEVIFTGGGTEASNTAIKGAVFHKPRGLFGLWARDAHLIISSIEHPATSVPCQWLRSLGCKLTILDVDGTGRVDPDDVRKAIGKKTRLVSIMHSNNEVGTLNPIRDIARICRERDIQLHTDVAQSLGKVPIDVNALGIDLMTIAGHKLYAPKGIGVLYQRRGVSLPSLIHGAGHERGHRAGTENVPYIVGLGEACRIAQELEAVTTDHLKSLRDRLHRALASKMGERLILNGHPEERLPNTLNVNFVGQIGSELLQRVPGVAASTGSACHEGKVSQSPVLCAMRVPPEIGQGALRLTVGRFTTEAEVDEAAELLAVQAL